MSGPDLPDGPGYVATHVGGGVYSYAPGRRGKLPVGELVAIVLGAILALVLTVNVIVALGLHLPKPTKWHLLARRYERDLLLSEAAGWRAGAAAIRGGKTIEQSEQVHQAEVQRSKVKRFDRLITPELERIAEKSSKLTPDQREAIADALVAMAGVYDHGRPQAPRPPPDPEPAPAPEPDPVPVPDPAPAPQPFAELPPMGWRDHKAAREQIIATLPTPTLTVALPGEVGGPGPDHVYLYKAWKEVLGDYPSYPAQQIGDCTSFGSGHCADLSQCIELALTGGGKDQYRETCTEAIYGMGRELAGMLRGGDGCYGAAVSKALTTEGAVTRELVGAYSGQRAKEWGRSGVPSEIKAVAAKHKLGGATLVTNLDEADAALRNCYAFIICSDQGFTLQRDADGVCEAQGSWPHCMFVAGMRTRSGERQYLICNSWGSKMPSGPISDDQPPFSFWARGRVIERMLAGRDSFAYSKFGPFASRPAPARWTYSGFAIPGPRFLGPPQLELTPGARPRERVPTKPISPLVRRITPDVVKALEARKPDILEDAGSWPRREAIKLAWPYLIREVPNLLQTCVDLVKEALEQPAPKPPDPARHFESAPPKPTPRAAPKAAPTPTVIRRAA